MYTLLIVEDMPVIRKGLIALINEAYEFNVVEASNGEEALEKILLYPIDFIITDIKMPICDGIELISQLRKKEIEIPIVIISGYGEFKYAEKAINMGVSGYLLKPVEDEALYSTIGKVIRKIEVKQKNKKMLYTYKNLKVQINEERFNYQLQQILFEKDIAVEFETDYLIDLKDKYYGVVVINIDGGYHYHTSFQYSDIELIKYAIKNILQEMNIAYHYYVVSHTVIVNQLTLLFFDKSKDGIEKDIYRICNLINQKVIELLNISLTMGISEVTNVLSEAIYRQAVDYLQMRFLGTEKNIFRHNVIENDKVYQVSIERLNLVEKYIQRGDIKNIRLILEGIFIVGSNQINPRKYIQYIIEAIEEIIIKLYGYEVYNMVNNYVFDEEMIYKTKDIEELIQTILGMIEKVYEAKHIRKIDNSHIALRVKEYIDGHYQEEIIVKSLAEKFNVNYSYLSATFTKEIGKSIVSYLTEVRMERAINLLQEGRGDIATIAEVVGYSDLQYFYKVFKKNTGKTPMSYRNITKK